MNIDETRILQRSGDLQVHLIGAEDVRIRGEGLDVRSGPHALAVLDAFAEPISVKEAMERLRGRAAGVQDWLDLLGTVVGLHEHGVLVEPGTSPQAGESRLDVETQAFHVMMLEDRRRTDAFLEAIARTVGPDDTVLDLGTGTGILAMAAARAGARHVYAIEAGAVADAADALIGANGLADRITLVRGWSTRVTLPERADVLVSETIGAQPFEERVLEITRDAFRRHLEPDARMIPARLRVYALPVPKPTSVVAERAFTPAALARWSEWYGFDFRPLADFAPDDVWFVHLTDAAVRELGTPATPVFLGEVELRARHDLVFEGAGEAAVVDEGTVGAVAVYWEMELADGIVLTNDPARAADTNHWADPVAVLPRPFEVRPGQRVRIEYRYAGGAAELEARPLGE